jgi:deazaflavin-dependent oxidoreductase (nitroreductase family)
MSDLQPRRTDMREFNKGVIANYRATGGKDGDGALQPLVLLTTVGAKSGREHTTPVNVRKDGDDLIVAGTKGGYPTHPQWYQNLQSNPELTVEGLVLTMWDPRNRLAHQVADEVRKHFRVFDSIIPRNVRLSEAPSHGLPALLYDVGSKGAQGYLSLAHELIGAPA